MKPVIKISTLNGSIISVFTQHITIIEKSPRGCLLHFSNGQTVETTNSVKQLEDAIGVDPAST